MNFLIRFFIDNPRINYVLLSFIFFMGIISYSLLPKEVFPDISTNSIAISGSYAGASPQSLNSFAVTEIENELSGIAGIDEIASYVQPNFFAINVELEDNVEINDIIDEIKDAVSIGSTNFPSDMDDVVVKELKRTRPLLNVILSSDVLDHAQLQRASKEIQSLLLSQADVSDVIVYGESDLQIDIYIDEKKVKAFGLDTASIIKSIQKLSYIYPLGDIDQEGNHLYLSSQNSKTDLDTWNNTLLFINDKKLYLSDVATISIDYPQERTLSRYNSKSSIDLSVMQGDTGNAIEIAKGIKKKISDYERKNPNTTLVITSDRSKVIKSRLDTVTSNIILGMILVGVLIFILISPRLSIVILMGVPFSFIITFIFLYFAGYTINMVTLLALLITIGIVVDDAIIVSENIQRHIDEGMKKKDAVIKGTQEVMGPVLIASATTIFAFMPLLMLSGRMGAIMLLIPVVVSSTIIASLIESFLFLPLHSLHILKSKEKMFDWTPIHRVHSKLLHYFVHFKKSFLVLFIVLVPLLTFYSIKSSHFQFFPSLDADSLTFSIQLDKSIPLEESDRIAKQFEQEILKHKEELFVEAINTTVGFYKAINGTQETINNAFTITLDLYPFNEDNWIHNYLNPIFTLNFDFEKADERRTQKSKQINANLRKILKPLIAKSNPVNVNLIGRRVGIVKTDISIDLSGKYNARIIKALERIKEKLAAINGVEDISDNAYLGKDEYKISVNAYGQSLGVTDESVASAIANLYIERTVAYTLHEEGVVEIKTQRLNKDSLEALKRLTIAVEDKFVDLRDIVDFTIVNDFAKIEKHDKVIAKTVYANVNPKTITANEVLTQLQPLFSEIKKQGIDVVIKGEKEQTQQMASELSLAFIISIFLIFLVLLLNFNSFKMVFIIISVIPFSVLGALVGHFIMGINLTFPSLIGILGLVGVVINDGIVMLDFLKYVSNLEEFYERVKLRVRPILITSLTTLLGLSTLIFYPSGQGVFLQPLAVSLGFGLLWGTILNLFYLPVIFVLLHKLHKKRS